MSSIAAYLNGINQARGIQSHNSVEGLIRSTLGNRFREQPISEKPLNEGYQHTQVQSQPQKQSHPQQSYTSVESALQSVNEVLNSSSELINEIENGSHLEETQTHKVQQKTNSTREEKVLSPFQKAILTMNESQWNELQQKFQAPPQTESPPSAPKPTPVYREPEPEPEEYYEAPKSRPVNRSRDYVFHRDADETFECTVNVEGGDPENTTARLVLKTDSWNVVFDGFVTKNGICTVPLKKLSLFPDGTTGKAYLEIVVEDVIFTPWESPFRVAMSKKVSVQSPSLNRR